MTEVTVNDIKVGSKLVMGAYGVDNNRPYPITWIKFTSNNDFISEKVLDSLAFDAKEFSNPNINFRVNGNNNYQDSNIVQFLCSDAQNWYHHRHEFDSPPSYHNVDAFSAAYTDHWGFLYHFTISEIDALCGAMRLPTLSDITESEYFSKHGKRAHISADLLLKSHIRNNRYNTNSYSEFWLSPHTIEEGFPCIYDRSGSVRRRRPMSFAGVRPVCTLKSNTKLIVEGNAFRIADTNGADSPFGIEELAQFLGITQ